MEGARRHGHRTENQRCERVRCHTGRPAYSRRRLAKARTRSVSASARRTGATLVAGPPIAWTGRAATCRRFAAVAVTALATLLLNVAGVTGARTPPVPLSADNKAE